MSIRLRRAATMTAAAGLAALGLTIATSTAASAGQLVTIDLGDSCAVVWQNDDGSYTDWHRGDG